MSLQADGVWKGALWAPTVWASGVWFENAAAATPPVPAVGQMDYPISFVAKQKRRRLNPLLLLLG